jgi:hypothetical protein
MMCGYIDYTVTDANFTTLNNTEIVSDKFNLECVGLFQSNVLYKETVRIG